MFSWRYRQDFKYHLRCVLLPFLYFAFSLIRSTAKGYIYHKIPEYDKNPLFAT
jgi:hypothetical protein